MKKPKILITNDDGIESPGLKAAAESVLGLGEVFVIAPTTQQTGTGRGLTGGKQSKLKPVRYAVGGVDVTAFHCECSPALIVRHSLKAFFHGDGPDLIISGINYGENLGSSVTCSGTVGAVLEGASEGIPGIAVSKQTDIESHYHYSEQDWATTAYFLRFFAQLLLEGNMMSDVDILKIDVPENATPETAWKLTRLSRSGYYFRELENPGIDSELYAGKVVIKIDEDRLEPGTDIHTFAIRKLVSVTPLSIDLSSRVNLDELKKLYVGN